MGRPEVLCPGWIWAGKETVSTGMFGTAWLHSNRQLGLGIAVATSVFAIPAAVTTASPMSFELTFDGRMGKHRCLKRAATRRSPATSAKCLCVGEPSTG